MDIARMALVSGFLSEINSPLRNPPELDLATLAELAEVLTRAMHQLDLIAGEEGLSLEQLDCLPTTREVEEVLETITQALIDTGRYGIVSKHDKNPGRGENHEAHAH